MNDWTYVVKSIITALETADYDDKFKPIFESCIAQGNKLLNTDYFELIEDVSNKSLEETLKDQEYMDMIEQRHELFTRDRDEFLLELGWCLDALD